MRHAVFFPAFNDVADPRVCADLAAEAEAHGWDGCFVWDHVMYRETSGVADPWIVMAAQAAATERIRLGPMVTPLPRRRPAVVARQVASLDQLSNGRLTFGVGIGGDRSRELSALGEELDARTRADMLDEQLDLLDRLWSGHSVDHRGEHYTAAEVQFTPVPVQRPRPPIWVGARWPNPRPIARALRYEGLFPVELETTDQLAELRAHLDDHGAGPDFDLAVLALVASPDEARANGATWWVHGFPHDAVNVDWVRGVIADGPPAG